ncbi:MAG: YdbH domain-containing protein, partial [Sneathiella sp.]
MSAGRKAGKIGKAVLGVIFLIAALFVFAVLFRTTVLELAGKTALNFYGFKEVSLAIDAVGTDYIHIDQLSLSEQIILRNVSVQFRPLSLFSGQIDEINIGGLFLDISDSARGALARISQMAGEGDAKSTASTKLSYPKVELQKGTIVAEKAGISLSAALSGALTSDLELTAQSSLQGSIDTVAGPLLFDNMQFSVEADIAAQTARVELTDGLLRHDVEMPDWTPLSLAGAGHLADGTVEMQMGLRTSEGKALAQLDGRYETETKNGELQASLNGLSFRRDGFQPSDLSRYAHSLPPFDGALDLTANAEITGPMVVYEADITMDNLLMELDGGQVTAERLPLRISGRYLLDDGMQDTKIVFPKSDAVLIYSGHEYHVNDLAASLDIINLAKKVELVSLSGSVRHNSENAYFSPLSFNASGEMDYLREIAVNGSLRDGSGKFDLDIAGLYRIDEGSGNVSFHLPPTKVASVSGFSPILRPMDSLSGIVTGRVEIARENDGNLIIPSARIELSGGSWKEGDIEVSGLALDLSATQGAKNEPLLGSITGHAAKAQINEQRVIVQRLEASFEMIHNKLQPETGSLSLTNLKLVPDEGAFFKETQTITGTGRIKDTEIDFSLDAQTDLLGSYLNIAGRHSLSAAAGSAQMDIKPLSFANDGLQLKDLAAFEVELTLNGRIVPDAIINWSAEGLKSSADVTLENLSIDASGGSVSDMNGKVHIDELFPLTISTSQEITAATAVAGMPLDNPLILFRVLTEAGVPQLYIDRMSVGLVGGSAIVDGAVIDTGAETNRIEVQLTSLDLEEVMALSDVEELVATGKVSGRIPLVFGGERLIVEDAMLSADGPGILKMTSDAARQALDGGGEQAKLLLEILDNFQYSELSIEIMKTQSGEDTVKLHA